MDPLIKLDLGHLSWALGLMAIAIGLSAWQRLGLELNLAIATGRTIIQLFIVGYLLAFVFAWHNPWAVLLVLLIMLGIASVVARSRIGKKIPHLLLLVAGAIVTSTGLTLVYINVLVLRPDPWYEPQYVIPIAGILLGNAMNAAAIAGERFVSVVNASQLEIETHLSLGATPQQATVLYRRESIKAGVMPTLNSMLVVGIVTLPGIITGQILGGIDPFNAALYQMLIMFMLGSTTLFTAFLITQGLCRQYFTKAAQLVLY